MLLIFVNSGIVKSKKHTVKISVKLLISDENFLNNIKQHNNTICHCVTRYASFKLLFRVSNKAIIMLYGKKTLNCKPILNCFSLKLIV